MNRENGIGPVGRDFLADQGDQPRGMGAFLGRGVRKAGIHGWPAAPTCGNLRRIPTRTENTNDGTRECPPGRADHRRGAPRRRLDRTYPARGRLRPRSALPEFARRTRRIDRRASSRCAPSSTLALQADLADFERLPDLVDATLARFGRLDGLVNNASSFHPTAFGDGRTGAMG